MIGLGLTLWPRPGHNGPPGPVYDPDAEAYFAAMSVEPDPAQKARLNALIVALKADGLWAKLDWLQVLAAHHEQAGRINARNPAQVATAVNGPVFTAYRGFQGDGATSYLDTGWNPTTASSPKFGQDDAHMGVWVESDPTSGSVNASDIGNNVSRINTRYFGSNIRIRGNGPQVDIGGNTSGSGVGHTLWSRTDDSTLDAYKDAELLETVAGNTSTTLHNGTFLIGARRTTTGVSEYSPRRVAVAHWGSTLDADDAAALHAALSTYLTAVGAI